MWLEVGETQIIENKKYVLDNLMHVPDGHFKVVKGEDVRRLNEDGLSFLQMIHKFPLSKWGYKIYEMKEDGSEINVTKVLQKGYDFVTCI